MLVIDVTKEKVINATYRLVYASKKMELHVNERKTENVQSRKPPNIDSNGVYDVVIHLKNLMISNTQT